MDWFVYDKDLRHERVKKIVSGKIYRELISFLQWEESIKVNHLTILA